MYRLASRLSSSSSTLRTRTAERTCTECRRNLVAVSTASDTLPQRGGGRKVSKDERRSLVESFVNKYRVMNSGKFPTVKDVRNGVGGSHYVVKKIVQELQYKSQIPSTGSRINMRPDEKVEPETEPSGSIEDSSRDMRLGEEISTSTKVGALLGTEEVKKAESSSGDVDHVPSGQNIELIDIDVPLRDLEKGTAREGELTEFVEAIKKVARSDIQLHENADSMTTTPGLEEVLEKSSKDNGPAKRSKEIPITEEGHQTLSAVSKTSNNETEELMDSKYVPELVVEPKDRQEETLQAGDCTRDAVKEDNGDAEARKESFAWKHLKSLADGIMRIWGKL